MSLSILCASCLVVDAESLDPEGRAQDMGYNIFVVVCLLGLIGYKLSKLSSFSANKSNHHYNKFNDLYLVKVSASAFFLSRRPFQKKRNN